MLLECLGRYCESCLWGATFVDFESFIVWVSLLWGEAQDLEDGYYQELIAFILFLKRQTKAAFDFSSSAGRDKQCMVGGGLPSPTLR